jgi:ABC-type phosphate/phosphonate transport system ATPase subunit
MSDYFKGWDFDDFFRRLQGHQLVVNELKGKSFFMLIGCSGVGKSTLGSLLIGRQLILQERKVETTTGKIRSVGFVISLEPQPGDFEIGHGSASGTKCIHAALSMAAQRFMLVWQINFFPVDRLSFLSSTSSLASSLQFDHSLSGSLVFYIRPMENISRKQDLDQFG